MLENIHIQNFRCFEDFKAEGFERINLIGGKNNSGKSCLLDSIATFSKNFNPFNISAIRPALVNWNNFIYKYAKTSTVEVKASDDISFKALTLEKQFVGFNKGGNLINTFYITQFGNVPNLSSFKLFNQNDLKAKMVSFLKIIDVRISDIRTIQNDTKLEIKIGDLEFEELANFGDAVVSFIKFFTPLLDIIYLKQEKEYSLMLIDEIENGLHYTAHEEFWRHIFKLSKKLNVQIFATTHSLEMIQQFNKVAKEEGDAAYFEMFRNEEENKIKCIKHETDILEYELETKENFRGEQL